MNAFFKPIRVLRESFYQINAAVSASCEYSRASSISVLTRKADPASAAIPF